MDIIGCLDKLDSALIVVLFKVALATSSTENLGLNNELVLFLHTHLPGNHLSLLGGESDLPSDNGDSVLVEEVPSLVLMELDASLG